MEDHYTAVVLKNINTPQPPRRQPVARKGNLGAGMGPTPPRKKGVDTSSKPSAKKSRSKSPSKGRKKKGKKAGGKGKRGGEPTAASKKVYSSASAFMAKHFPSEDQQVGGGGPR